MSIRNYGTHDDDDDDDDDSPSKSFGLGDYLEWQLLKNRTIVFQGEVAERACKEACRKLLYLSSVSKEPITIVLNSVGGEVYNGVLVYDTIRSIVNEGINVVVEARGLAASMGLILLQSGSRRLVSKHTRILMHEVSSVAWGKSSEVEEQMEEIKKVNNMIKEILAEKTGKTSKEIEKIWHKKDCWFSSDEALEFGLCDEVVN